MICDLYLSSVLSQFYQLHYDFMPLKSIDMKIWMKSSLWELEAISELLIELAIYIL